MKALTTTILIAVVGLLSACTSSPPQTLEEKLAGKTPQEQQRVMRNACLTEAEWRQDQLISYNTRHYGAARARNNLPYMADVVRMKDVCWEMTKLYPPEKG